MKHEEINTQQYYKIQLVRINLLLPLGTLKFKLSCKLKSAVSNKIVMPFYMDEVWNFNCGNYLFTTDTK